MKLFFTRIRPRPPAWLFCLSVALASLSASGEEQTAAAAAQPPAGFDNLARDIALGRFQTRLEQDIQLLERVRKLLETLRHLAPYTGVVDTLFSGAPEEDRLLQALSALRMHVVAREAPSVTSLPPASTSAELPPAPAAPHPQVLLNFAAPAQGNHPGKAILRVGQEYKILYQGEELMLYGVPHLLEKVERDRVTLRPREAGAPPYVVQWR